MGRGNTSNVRLATDLKGHKVAVKIPHPSILKNQEAAERFANEVRLTLRFRHPHLIRGYAGTAFGSEAFLAMEYFVEGPLSDRLALARRQVNNSNDKVEPLTLDEIYRILADVCDGLAFIHKEKAVHQDIKTQNVYLKNGRAYLGDFGSTYFIAQGGKVSGSPFYMAPEIYHGLDSSSASDIYSLGVLAYELLTDTRPFVGSTYEELMVAHLTGIPNLIHRNKPEVSADLSQIINGCLAKEAKDRPNIDEIHAIFKELLGEQTVISTPNMSAQDVSGRHGRHALPSNNAINASAHPDQKHPDPDAKSKSSRGGIWKFFQRKK